MKKNNLFIADIDDTLLKSSKEQIAVIKNTPNGKIRLSSEEYAKDPDSKNETLFSFEEFRDPDKIYNSIVSGKPLVRNLKIMDKYLNKGYGLSILSARSHQKIVLEAIKKFLLYKDKNGNFEKIDNKIIDKVCACTNDTQFINIGKNTPERKAKVITEISKQFDKIVFMDDCKNNLEEIKKLGLKNVKLVLAK